MKYRIQFDGHYVKECDYEYLVKCTEKESIFSEFIAKTIEKQAPKRIKIFKIITKEYVNEKYKKQSRT